MSTNPDPPDGGFDERAQLELLGEILITADRVAEKVVRLAKQQKEILSQQEEILDRLEQFAEVNEILLNENSKAITEHAIHQELQMYEERLKRRKALAKRGGGGFDIVEGESGSLVAK